MDYGALPPEVNSGRMYVGPGSGPLLAAAAAWDGLATDLYTTAASYGSVISELTGVWLGPASASMAAAASPYLAWLNSTAGHAEQAAIQAKSAVAAYEAAFAMTVPPPVIAANRALLMTLIATNFFGQNLPAIAATEAHYAEMWAQDAAAMYGYAGASAGASTLSTFEVPPPTTNPGGQAGQAAAVAHAAETAVGTSVKSLSSVPSTLQAMTLPASSGASTPGTTTPATPGSILAWLLGQPTGSGSWASSPLSQLMVSLYHNDMNMVYHHLGDAEHFMKIQEGMPSAASAGKGADIAAKLPGIAGILGGQLGGGAPASVSASAVMGNAGTVGNLSVPPSWPTAAPTTSAATAAAKVGNAATAPGTRLGSEGLLRGIPLAAAPGAGVGRRPEGVLGRRYGFRHSVMARPFAGG